MLPGRTATARWVRIAALRHPGPAPPRHCRAGARALSVPLGEVGGLALDAAGRGARAPGVRARPLPPGGEPAGGRAAIPPALPRRSARGGPHRSPRGGRGPAEDEERARGWAAGSWAGEISRTAREPTASRGSPASSKSAKAHGPSPLEGEPHPQRRGPRPGVTPSQAKGSIGRCSSPGAGHGERCRAPSRRAGWMPKRPAASRWPSRGRPRRRALPLPARPRADPGTRCRIRSRARRGSRRPPRPPGARPPAGARLQGRGLPAGPGAAAGCRARGGSTSASGSGREWTETSRRPSSPGALRSTCRSRSPARGGPAAPPASAL